jgi:hypothetical protein
MTPAINNHRCRCYQRLIIAGVVVTADKLITSVMESMTPGINTKWRKSLRTFVKVRNGPNGNLRGPGKTGNEITLK